MSEPRDVREALTEAGRDWASGQYRILGLAVDLDESGEWLADGARTCAQWIASRLSVAAGTAREWLRIGRLLRSLPVIDAAFANGRLSYSKVRVLTRVATAENEGELCALTQDVPADRVHEVVAAWLGRHEDPLATDHRHQRDRSVRWRTEWDGMVSLNVRLPPRQAAGITAMIDRWVLRNDAHHASADASHSGPRRWPSLAQQRADGLVALLAGGGGGTITEVILHVRGDGCTLDDGTPVTGTVVERIAPRAFLRALVHDAEGRPINASPRRRHPTTRQKRVVKERDRVCVDCGSSDLLEYDHDPPFAETRRTVTDELSCRCAPCHQRRQPPPAWSRRTGARG